MKLRSRDVPSSKPTESRQPIDGAAVRLVRQSLQTLDKAIEKNTEAVAAGLDRKPVPYRFTFKRNADGLLLEIIATPIKD